LIQQHGILVDLVSIQLDKTLPDRLDESDPIRDGAQRGKQRQAGSGLAIVHAGSRNEDTLGRFVPGRSQVG